MARNWVLGILVGVGVSATNGCACSSGDAASDSSCTAETCQLLVDRCHLEASVVASYCLTAVAKQTGNTPTDFSTYSGPECVKECVLDHSGAFFACAAQHADLCTSDAGRVEPQPLLDLCVTNTSSADRQTCLDKCWNALKPCVLACSAPTIADCLPCGEKCDQDEYACEQQCPAK